MRIILRRALRRFAPVLAMSALAALAGCGGQTGGGTASLPPPPPPTWSVPPGPGPAYTPVSFDQLPGWSADHLSLALPAFLASCAQLTANPGQNLGGSGETAALAGTARQWRAACQMAHDVPPGDDRAARQFFEAAFQPYGVSADGSAIGLFTGYYEPEVAGSLTPDSTYKYPLYRRPPDLHPGGTTLYPARAEIDQGALARKHLELLWLADPVDVFFLHVQGAGRVRLPDGRVIRVNYDGQNGRPYVPIGRVLVDRGEMTLDQVSMQSIRAWLTAHPGQARDVMDQNPSYVFFREVPDIAADLGAPGTLGAPLTPGRSAAVDKGFIPLGTPIWIATRDTLDGSPIRRLLMAQDLGGAIRGPVRADIFFGWGPDAEAHAGKMRGQGTEFLLLPRGG